MPERSSKDTRNYLTCSWCGTLKQEKYLQHLRVSRYLDFYLCLRCWAIAGQSLVLGEQVARLIPKGGIELYVGVERTGRQSELLSVKKWSPLEEPLDASSVEESLTTYPSLRE